MTNKRTFKNALQAEQEASEQVYLADVARDRALDQLATTHIAYRIARADAGDCCEQCAEAASHETWEARQAAMQAFFDAHDTHADALNAWSPLNDRLEALKVSEPKVIPLQMH